MFNPYLVGFVYGMWRRQWHPTPVLLPGKSHGWRSLVGCNPCGLEESDTTEWLHFHYSLSCTGEGNGNPLHCSCLENPRDGGAWWAAIYGVAQSRTRLKWLSSSSSSQTIKRPAPWEKSYDKPGQCIKKQRHHFSNKGLYSQSYGFSSSHVWMWELDHREGWALKNWCFQTVVLEKILESPLESKDIKSVNPKGNQSWIFTRKTDAEAEALIVWPPDGKSHFIEKEPDAGKD